MPSEVHLFNEKAQTTVRARKCCPLLITKKNENKKTFVKGLNNSKIIDIYVGQSGFCSNT